MMKILVALSLLISLSIFRIAPIDAQSQLISYPRFITIHASAAPIAESFTITPGSADINNLTITAGSLTRDDFGIQAPTEIAVDVSPAESQTLVAGTAATFTLTIDEMPDVGTYTTNLNIHYDEESADNPAAILVILYIEAPTSALSVAPASVTFTRSPDGQQYTGRFTLTSQTDKQMTGIKLAPIHMLQNGTDVELLGTKIQISPPEPLTLESGKSVLYELTITRPLGAHTYTATTALHYDNQPINESIPITLTLTVDAATLDIGGPIDIPNLTVGIDFPVFGHPAPAHVEPLIVKVTDDQNGVLLQNWSIVEPFRSESNSALILPPDVVQLFKATAVADETATEEPNLLAPTVNATPIYIEPSQIQTFNLVVNTSLADVHPGKYKGSIQVNTDSNGIQTIDVGIAIRDPAWVFSICLLAGIGLSFFVQQYQKRFIKTVRLRRRVNSLRQRYSRSLTGEEGIFWKYYHDRIRAMLTQAESLLEGDNPDQDVEAAQQLVDAVERYRLRWSKYGANNLMQTIQNQRSVERRALDELSKKLGDDEVSKGARRIIAAVRDDLEVLDDLKVTDNSADDLQSMRTMLDTAIVNNDMLQRAFFVTTALSAQIDSFIEKASQEKDPFFIQPGEPMAAPPSDAINREGDSAGDPNVGNENEEPANVDVHSEFVFLEGIRSELGHLWTDTTKEKLNELPASIHEQEQRFDNYVALYNNLKRGYASQQSLFPDDKDSGRNWPFVREIESFYNTFLRRLAIGDDLEQRKQELATSEEQLAQIRSIIVLRQSLKSQIDLFKVEKYPSVAKILRDMEALYMQTRLGGIAQIDEAKLKVPALLNILNTARLDQTITRYLSVAGDELDEGYIQSLELGRQQAAKLQDTEIDDSKVETLRNDLETSLNQIMQVYAATAPLDSQFVQEMDNWREEVKKKIAVQPLKTNWEVVLQRLEQERSALTSGIFTNLEAPPNAILARAEHIWAALWFYHDAVLRVLDRMQELKSEERKKPILDKLGSIEQWLVIADYDAPNFIETLKTHLGDLYKLLSDALGVPVVPPHYASPARIQQPRSLWLKVIEQTSRFEGLENDEGGIEGGEFEVVSTSGRFYKQADLVARDPDQPNKPSAPDWLDEVSPSNRRSTVRKNRDDANEEKNRVMNYGNLEPLDAVTRQGQVGRFLKDLFNLDNIGLALFSAVVAISVLVALWLLGKSQLYDNNPTYGELGIPEYVAAFFWGYTADTARKVVLSFVPSTTNSPDRRSFEGQDV